jgi:hypothetical protein
MTNYIIVASKIDDNFEIWIADISGVFSLLLFSKAENKNKATIEGIKLEDLLPAIAQLDQMINFFLDF